MRRVVVTGMGMVTPLGDGVDTNWRRLMAAESGIRVDPGVRHLRPRDQDRGRGAAGRQGERPLQCRRSTCRRRTSASSTSSSIFGMAAAEQAVEDSGWKPQDEEGLNRTGVMIGAGIGGLQHDLRDVADPEGARAAPGQPVLHPVGADQPRLGPGLDQVRLQGPEPFGGHGLRHRRACAGRRRAPDPARGCRRHGGGRRRGRDLPHRHRRLQRLQGPVDRLQRHADRGVAAVGQAARRLRDGRRRGLRRARGIRARQEARRQDLRRDPGLRPVGRRLSHHRAVRGRRRRACAP